MVKGIRARLMTMLTPLTPKDPKMFLMMFDDRASCVLKNFLKITDALISLV
jgi:hypothetical protein